MRRRVMPPIGRLGAEGGGSVPSSKTESKSKRTSIPIEDSAGLRQTDWTASLHAVHTII